MIFKKIQCPFCFEKFEITLYAEEGAHQDMVYDCEICCHPIDVHVTLDEESGKLKTDVKKSSGF